MNPDSKLVLRRFARQTATRALLAPVLALLVAATPADAGSREAVKKALAAAVAVEWRSDEKASQQAGGPPVTTGHFHEEQRVEFDPETEQEVVRTIKVGARSQPISEADISLSSGIMVSADGLVATLSREQGEGRYTVYLQDGRKLLAHRLVDDHRSGLRLLKIDARGLEHLAIADAEAEPGDQVYAAFATDHRGRAAAQGMVAARAAGGTLQLDLLTGRMSSGGPLVDEQGRLIGMLSGKSARSPAEDLYNFALPASAVRALVAARQGENTVVVHRGILGISMQEGPEGRLKVSPRPDSPALAAGMHDGDELVAIDDERISSAADAAAAVRRHSPGEKVVVTIRRDGQEQKLQITTAQPPEARPEATNVPAAPLAPPRVTANRVLSGQVYVLTPEGKKVAVRLAPSLANGAPAGALAVPVPDVIRVERSDLEKKLDAFGRNVESLQQQVEKLTAEIKSLREKLGEQK